MNVDRDDSTISFDLALSTAKLYGLTEEEADSIISEMCKIIKTNWESLAEKYNLSRGARQYMQPAFFECYAKESLR